jgi:hypothetical protein
VEIEVNAEDVRHSTSHDLVRGLLPAPGWRQRAKVTSSSPLNRPSIATLTTSTPSGRRLDDDVPDLIIKAARFGSEADVRELAPVAGLHRPEESSETAGS